MRNMAVNATIGNESVQMKGGVILLCILHGSLQRRILKESSLADRLRNLRQILIYNTARSHIQVSDF